MSQSNQRGRGIEEVEFADPNDDPDDPDDTAEDSQITVVVADDHPMWRDAVARDLLDAGFQVAA